MAPAAALEVALRAAVEYGDIEFAPALALWKSFRSVKPDEGRE